MVVLAVVLKGEVPMTNFVTQGASARCDVVDTNNVLQSEGK